MHRLLKRGASALAFAGLVACSGSSGVPEADVVVAPEVLARALADDRESALAEYGGKVLELSGTVGEKVEPGGLNPTLGVVFASIDESLRFEANLSFVSFDPEDSRARSEFEGLSVGDDVTLHCALEGVEGSSTLHFVKSCRVVS